MPSSPLSPILLTGVTGGLGARILSTLLTTFHIPPSELVATARRESERAAFEARRLQFRIVDYDDKASLEPAFQGVQTLLFMSSSTSDSAVRMEHHGHVVEAAVAAGVKRVWYVSLALGGWGSESRIGFQTAHYDTELRLMRSGLDFLSLRAGVYADAFPLFLNWYPATQTLLLPHLEPGIAKGQIAFTTRDELGDGIATLLAKGLEAFPSIVPQGARRIVLLTGAETSSLVDLIDAINRTRKDGQGKVEVKYVEPEEWVETSAEQDEGGKPKAYFEAAVGTFRGFIDGDAETVDPALETLLGRKPESGKNAVERLIREAPDGKYVWHQNYKQWKNFAQGKPGQ